MNTNMKKKTLVASILTIALCFSVIAGATFALFTSESDVNIAVTSGQVKLVATIDESSLATSSLGVEQEAGKFANGGTATFDEDTNLTLTNVTPGDKATFNINVENESNVDIMYKITWTVNKEGLDALEVTSNGEALADLGWTLWQYNKEDEVSAISGEWQDTSAATEYIPYNSNTKTLPVEIELPMGAGNDYQNKEASISFAVEAIQANAVVEEASTEEQILAAIEAGATELTLVNDIELNNALEVVNDIAIDLGGYEIAGNIVVSNNANLKLSNGSVANDDADVSAIELNGGNATLNNVNVSSARHGVRVEGGKLVINGGEYDVKLAASGTTLYAVNVGGASEASELIINSGTFIGPNQTNADNGAAVLVQGNATAIINGGNFSEGTEREQYGFGTVWSWGNLKIRGGTFDEDPSTFVDSAPGYSVINNENGTWTVNFDLASAITGAETSGATVTLPTDVKWGLDKNRDQQNIVKNTSLDLNGNTFEATYSYDLSNNADLTMKNGTYYIPASSSFGKIHVKPSNTAGSEVTFENVHFLNEKFSSSSNWGTDRLEQVVQVGTDYYSDTSVQYAKTVIVFKNCTFDNAQVYFWGTSDKYVQVEAIFENCTFNATTNGAPIDVNNYVKGTITVKNCTFNIKATSSSATAINITTNNNTEVTLIAEGNTFNAEVASGAGVTVNGSFSSIDVIKYGTNTTANITNTTMTGIAVN